MNHANGIRTFTVMIGARTTTIRIFPRHLDSEEAEAHRDASTGEINIGALALARGVRKLYGSRAKWRPSSSGLGFGQITVEYPPTQTYVCITPRVCVTVASR